MHAAVLRSARSPLVIEELAQEEPRAGEVAVRMGAAGIRGEGVRVVAAGAGREGVLVRAALGGLPVAISLAPYRGQSPRPRIPQRRGIRLEERSARWPA